MCGGGGRWGITKQNNKVQRNNKKNNRFTQRIAAIAGFAIQVQEDIATVSNSGQLYDSGDTNIFGIFFINLESMVYEKSSEYVFQFLVKLLKAIL